MLERNLRKQRVYVLAIWLAAYVYRVTKRIPADARPVRRQLIRSVTSIGLNIAEGWGESSPAEKARFYRSARRSAAETLGALDILLALKAIDQTVIARTDPALDEIHAMLIAMSKTQEAAAANSGRRSPRRQEKKAIASRPEQRPTPEPPPTSENNPGGRPSPSPSPSPSP